MEVDGELLSLSVWDTYTGPSYMNERLRPLAYPGTHAFLVCFALDNLDSLENVTTKWMPEILHFNDPTTPILLVGCKKDIRDEWVDLHKRHVSKE